ncbi:hypothetical protein Q2E61_13725 [Microbulbifer thermotolerans]|uniref:hypothetical protein n=1 Tax=Microbulbifer thermotolerans TaxID=252514 RepID=UPI0026722AF2|nr:hypothetical protein [Microbulbifer thermotolerans]WKT59953.1 hypothetical protein Q2E61_13725 [Microbulbifer thermotolerans]
MAYIRSRHQSLVREDKKHEVSEVVNTITADKSVSWDNKPIGKIGLSVVAVILAAFLACLVSKYFGIDL